MGLFLQSRRGQRSRKWSWKHKTLARLAINVPWRFYGGLWQRTSCSFEQAWWFFRHLIKNKNGDWKLVLISHILNCVLREGKKQTLSSFVILFSILRLCCLVYFFLGLSFLLWGRSNYSESNWLKLHRSKLLNTQVKFLQTYPFHCTFWM